MADGQSAIFQRDAELATVAAALAAGAAGRGSVVLVEGPAGIGKTTLVRAACSAAAEIRVITARGIPLDRGFAFGVVRQLFDPVRFSAPGDWGGLLDGAAALAARVFDGGTPGGVEDDVPYAVMHGLYWLTANLAAARPLVIAVDDAHWSDAPSLRWLAHLAARIEDLPVTLMLASRTGPEQPGLLAEIGTFASSRIALPALGEAAAAALVRSRLGSAVGDDLCRACHQSTGGNPFLLHSLTGELRSAGPVSGAAVAAFGPRNVAASVLRQVDQLGAGAVAVARALAVLGGPAQSRQVAALAGLDIADVMLLADKLRACEVLAPGTTLDFAHPIVRNAVQESAPAGERALAHARAARLLAADGIDPERVALHLLGTEPAGDDRVVESLRAAAAAAQGRGAPESAAEYLRRALTEPPGPHDRAEVLLEMGIALAAARSPEAPRTLRDAVARTADRKPAALASARVLGVWGYHDSAADIARDALLGSRAAHTSAEAEDLAAEFFANAWIIPAMRDEAWVRAGDRLTAKEHPAWHVLGALAETTRAQPPQAAMTRLGPVLASGLAGIAPDSLTAMYAMLTLVWNDQLELALGACNDVLTDARARGAMSMVTHVSALRSMTLRRTGQLTAAAEDAELALSFKLSTSPPVALAWMGTFCLEALTRLGRLEAAEAVAATVAERRPPPGWVHTNMFLQARAELRLAQQRYADALVDAAASADGWRALGFENPGIATWRTTAAAAYLAEGRAAEAAAVAAEQLALARATGPTLAHAAALRASAQGDMHPGSSTSLPAAEQSLREASGIFEFLGARHDLGLTLVDLGACLRRAGRISEAREPLRRALDLAEKTGAAPLRDYARRELAATGARPRRAALEGPDALTNTERQVADLAAAGRSNKQIAQHLFVTTGTVETHLRHIFQKLNVTSRTEILAKLAAAPV